MSVNYGLKATTSIGQTKAFYRQKVPESSCARKKSVDIDILVTSRDCNRKIMQSTRRASRSTSKKEVEPGEPVAKNVYLSNTYRNDLS